MDVHPRTLTSAALAIHGLYALRQEKLMGRDQFDGLRAGLRRVLEGTEPRVQHPLCLGAGG